MNIHRFLVLILTVLMAGMADADSIRVAAASNFRQAMTSLARQFEEETGHQAILIFGSSGKQYAQIIHGAPFDAFFSADSARPALLEELGKAVPGSRFTYAYGQLVLWYPRATLPELNASILETGEFNHLAIANPKLAPYGKAAEETLATLGLRDSLSQRLVRGENIAQTFQFVMSGNAELGFVAWSQLQSFEPLTEGSYWPVPPGMHRPIEQQAVQLRDDPVTRAFMLFVRSDTAIKIIREHGYNTPR